MRAWQGLGELKACRRSLSFTAAFDGTLLILATRKEDLACSTVIFINDQDEHRCTNSRDSHGIYEQLQIAASNGIAIA